MEAQEFRLKDAKGRTKAVLGLDQAGEPSLLLYGSGGCIVYVGIEDCGTAPTLSLMQVRAGVNVELHVCEHGDAALDITAEEGEAQAMLCADRNGTRLMLVHPKSEAVVVLGIPQGREVEVPALS